MNKYNIGDTVIVRNNKQKGTIVKINATLYKGETIYEVAIGQNRRLYREKYLDLFMSKEDEDFKNEISKLSKEDINNNLLDGVSKIIKELNLYKSNDINIQAYNACKLQKYLATGNVKYQEFISNNNMSITNSYIFSKVLTSLGINVLNIETKDINDNLYVTNLVLIGNKYYYFDSTLDKELYEEDNDEDFILSVAGIGKKLYEKFFTPINIVNLDNNKRVSSLPKNISDSDLDVTTLNKLIGITI